MRQCCFAVCTLLLFAGPFAAGAEDLPQVTFKSGDAVLQTTGRDAVELEIDSLLKIELDREALFHDVAALSGASGGSELLARIQFLERAIPPVVLAQQKLIETRVAAAELSAEEMKLQDRSAPAAQARLQALTARLESLNSNLSTAVLSALVPLRNFRTSDPELYKNLNNAVLGKDYTRLAEVLRDRIQQLDQDLVRAIAEGPKVGVLVTATLVDSTGKQTALHLEGYDTIAVGNPTPFPRFRLAPDERTRTELDAATKLAPLVNTLINERDSAFQQAVDELKATLKSLPEKLGLDEQIQSLEELAKSLEDSGEQALQPFAERVRSIKDHLASISGAQIPDSTNIVEVVEAIQGLTDDLLNLREELPATIAQLQAELITALGTTLPEIATQAKKTLGDLRSGLLANSKALRTFRDQITDAIKALRVTGELANAAEAATRRAKELNVGVPLDTSLDLQTVAAERHPGDLLHVGVQVEHIEQAGGKSTPLIQGRQTFRLEKYGWWAETRGALLLVDPRGEIERDVAYQPVPGLGYHWHYGFKGRPFLNHDLAFGLGLSLALLDFQDKDDFELGIAASATILRDIFWVGYGRNLQAKSNFFYVGVNPLTLAELFRR